ncbi:MAG: hypothetical protein SGILL_002092, partial [Bacillariaceae sp.]
MGSYTVGGPYLEDLSTTFTLPKGCSATCTGCEAINPYKPSDFRNKGCKASAGETWCPELKRCIQPFETNCPFGGEVMEGSIVMQCNNGRCNGISEQCELNPQGGGVTLGGPYVDGLKGQYLLPEG